MRRSALAMDPATAFEDDAELLQAGHFPRLTNISAGFLQDVMFRPERALPVEYVYVPVEPNNRLETVGRLVI